MLETSICWLGAGSVGAAALGSDVLEPGGDKVQQGRLVAQHKVAGVKAAFGGGGGFVDKFVRRKGFARGRAK
jgi:hypothetical protein